jgi:hypothetical protein
MRFRREWFRTRGQGDKERIEGIEGIDGIDEIEGIEGIEEFGGLRAVRKGSAFVLFHKDLKLISIKLND